MKLINIGFGNLVSSDKLVAVVAPDSAPVKRIVQEAKQSPARPFRTAPRKVRKRMINQNGKLVLYSGSSGVGKGTILKKLKELDENVWVSVSNTTRGPRIGEIAGVDYNYITREEFEDLIAQDGYLEYAKYCDNYYGTPLAPLNEKLAEGKTVFLEIEIEGALQVMKQYPDILSIFIVPPSFEELERRLRSRATEDAETIEKRLEKAKEEIGCRGRYKYNVINDDLDKAVREVYEIIHRDDE